MGTQCLTASASTRCVEIEVRRAGVNLAPLYEQVARLCWVAGQQNVYVEKV